MAIENDTVSSDEEKEKASTQGWADADQWKGDPAKWRTAREFLQKGDEILPVLKERLDTLSSQVGGLKTALDRKDQIIQRMMQFHEEDKQQAIKEAIAKLKVQRRAAITEGDADAVDAIDNEIESHKEASAKLKQMQDDADKVDTPDPNQISESYRQWIPENKWYEEDPQMAADADLIAKAYMDSGRFRDELSLMKAVTRRIKNMYPDYFNKQQTQQQGDPVEGAQRGSQKQRRRKGKFTYDDLPADAKAKCDEYVQRKIFEKPEDYVAIYFRDEIQQNR